MIKHAEHCVVNTAVEEARKSGGGWVMESLECHTRVPTSVLGKHQRVLEKGMACFCPHFRG